MKDSGSIRKLVAMGVVAGTGLLVLAGLVAWMDWTWGRGIFQALCHQRAERCFLLGESPLPLCARCVGIYGGIVAGCLAAWARPLRRGLAKRLAGPAPWVLLGVGVGVNLLDFGLETGGVYENAKAVRLLAGAILGAGIPWFVFSRTR